MGPRNPNSDGRFPQEETRRLPKWHEGNGTGDGYHLSGRNKALKGEPHERIRSETGTGKLGADQSVKRLRKPEDARRLSLDNSTTRPLPRAGRR